MFDNGRGVFDRSYMRKLGTILNVKDTETENGKPRLSLPFLSPDPQRFVYDTTTCELLFALPAPLSKSKLLTTAHIYKTALIGHRID